MTKFKEFITESRKKVQKLNEIFIEFDQATKLQAGQSRDAQMLRLSMIAELDAANLYEAMIPFISNRVAKKILQDVANEEKVHAGEFEYALSKVDPDWEQYEDEGEEEAEEMDEAIDKKMFALGRQVQDELHKVHGGMTLKPKDTDFAKAAKALGISKAKAKKAWNEFTWR